MKTWLLALLGFILFIFLGLSSQQFLTQSSQRLCMQINRFDSQLNLRRWQDAESQLNILARQWNRTVPLWAVLIHHQEIDNIENALIRLRKAVRSHDFSGSQMSSGELRHFLQHIPKREEFTLINIL